MARSLNQTEIQQSENLIKAVEEFLGLEHLDALNVVQAAVVGGECGRSTTEIESWISERLVPNTVFIDQDGYLEMCIAALRTVPSTVATDFGSSRQRDLGQIWGDKTRGYLGEFALKLFLKQKYAIEVDLAHEEGNLEDFLASDIARVRENGAWREPDLRVGVKSTKMNGIWLDIPNNQFKHSDVHVAVKLGVPTDHLFSFMKSVGVFKDKILSKGLEQGLIDETEARRINDEIPGLSRIPAYVCGIAFAEDNYSDLPYGGRMGSKNFTIDSWRGERRPGDDGRIRAREGAQKVQYERIGVFSHDAGFLFNTGSLSWNTNSWQDVVQRL
jgi:hypothetical protein